MSDSHHHAEHAEHGAAPLLGWWTKALAIGFICFGIGLPLIGARAFSGADLLLNKPPWRSAAPFGYQPQNPCVGDTIDAVEPAQQEFRNRAFKGDFASWEPYVAGGSPLASLPNLAAFSPLSLPFLLLPGWLAPGIEKLLEMLVSIGGTYLFLRRLRLGKAAATVAGVIFTSSGFLVTWTNWPQPRVAAFMPALFWAIERLVQRRSWRDVGLIALVIACMLFGGFPAVVGYALYLGAPYLLLRLLLEHRRRRVAGIGGGAVLAGVGLALGVAITAFQLLPFALHFTGIDLGYRHQTPGSHLPWFDLMTTWSPSVFGLCVKGTYWGPRPGNPIESISFVGATASVLALVGLTRRPHPGVPRGIRTYLGLALAVVVVLGWFGGPLLGLAQHLPVFSNNFVGRIRVLFGFIIAVLAGLGYDGLARWRPLSATPLWRRVLVLAMWAVAALGVLLTIRGARHWGVQVHRLADVAARMHRPAAVGAVAVLLVLVTLLGLRRWQWPRLAALALLPLLVVAESLWFVRPFWPRIERSQFYPATAAHDYLRAHLGGDRYAAQGLTLYTGTNAYYGLRSATGHAFMQPTWLRMLNAVDPHIDLTPTFTSFPFNVSDKEISSPLLDRMSVRYFAMDDTSVPLGRLEESGTHAGTTVLRDGQALTFSWPAEALRGVGLSAVSMPAPGDGFARIEATITDAAGTVVATGTRRLGGPLNEPSDLVAAVPGEDLGKLSGDLQVRLTLRSPGGRLTVRTRPDGRPVLVVAHSNNDGLRLEFTDGTQLYRRTTVLPRVRWAARTMTVGDEGARLNALRLGPPRDTTVLDRNGQPADGRPAAVQVREDSGDVVKAQVDAQGAGYLVLADAVQHDWTVTVDGKRADLVHADEAMAAVHVPQGRHEIAFAYAAGGRSTGLPVSAVALLVTLGLLGFDRRPRHEGV